MRGQAVARRYAEALLALATERGLVEKLDAESKALAELFADRQLRAFFGAPQIPSERKKQALDTALRGKVDPVMVNLARLLVDKDRILFLPQIMREFDHLTDELRGVEEVTISSAKPLSTEQQAQIVDNLKRFSAYGTLRVKTQVDPGLLGGVVVQLGSRVLDGSLASRLADMRERMTLYQGRGMGA
jgi:F-type H+-transporting ATPase subunit delta